MDLMHLGYQSRKTGIKPRKNLRKDEFNMEDIDDFFTDTNRQMSKSNPTTGLRKAKEPSRTKETIKKKNTQKIPPAEPRVYSSATQDAQTSSPDDPLPISSFETPMDEERNEWDASNHFQDDSFDYREHSRTSFDLGTTHLTHADRDHVHDPRQLGLAISPNRGPAVTKRMAQSRPRKSVNIRTFQDSSHGASTSNDSVEPSELSEVDLDSTTEVSQPSHELSHERGGSFSARSLPSPPPEGLRRSKRTKVAPLAFWRNERIVYSRANESNEDVPTSTLVRNILRVPLQDIVEVIHIPEKSTSEKKKPRRRTRKNPSDKLSQAKNSPSNDDSDKEIEGCEWFKYKSITTEVLDIGGNTSKRVIAWSPDGGIFQLPSTKDSKENFQVASLFNSDQDFFASGLLDFPTKGIKSLRNTKESLFIFHVTRGVIEVTLNLKTFTVKRGCSFEIPKYNTYSLRNLGQEAARLFFVQSQTPVE